MLWKLRFRWHITMAMEYMRWTTDEWKVRNPERYTRANMKWKYHTNKSLGLLRKRLDRLMKDAA